MSPRLLSVRTFICWLAIALGSAGASAQVTPPACVRLDTLLVMPLGTAEELRDYKKLREQMPDRSSTLLIAELERWFAAADSLGLVEDQIKAARQLVDRLRLDGLGSREYMWYADFLTIHLADVPAEEQFGVHNAIGNAKEAAGDLATALRYFVAAYKAAHPDSTHLQIYGLGNMAYVYLATGDTVSAQTAFKTTIGLSAALVNEQERYYNNVYDYCALGDIYRGRGLCDSADYYYRGCTKAFQGVDAGSGRFTEVEKLGRSAMAYSALFAEDFPAVEQQLDTLGRIYPEVAILLRVRMLEQQGRVEDAYRVLAQAEWNDDQSRDERLDLLIRLGRATGHDAEAATYATELIGDQRRQVKQAQQSLADLSATHLEAFERERLAIAQRYADELALLQSRQRVWFAVLGLLFSLVLASWALWRYRRSHRRSENLSELVDRQNEDLTIANHALESKVSELLEFNHLLSHDLREPLRSISGFVDLLVRRARNYPDLAEDLTFLSAATRQLKDLHAGVERLRKTKELRVRREPLDLSTLTERLVESFRAQAPAARIDLRVPESSVTIVTDPMILQTILWELLSNAVKFNPTDAPAVYVELYTHHGTTVLAVEDEGIGMEARYHTQIFEVFKRLNRREEFAGAGMGLAVAKTAATRLGAELSLARSVVTEGSRFTLALPRAAVEQTATIDPRQAWVA